MKYFVTNEDLYNELVALRQDVFFMIRIIKTILKEEYKLSLELEALTTEVNRNTDLHASAVAMIEGLADQVADLKDDPAALVALTTKLHDTADALAAAIVAHTEADPVVDPEPVANTEPVVDPEPVANTEFTV